MNWTNDYSTKRRADPATIGGGIMVAVVVVFFAVLCAISVKNARPPADAAVEYLDQLGVEYTRVVCATTDTDGDGYVSCTANTTSQGLVALECGALGTQCRMATGKVRPRPVPAPVVRPVLKRWVE